MAEMLDNLESTQTLESETIGIYRTAATVKGGRRFSFGALVVVGDRNGNVGLGYGKAPEVPAAIEKAQKNAKRKMTHVIIQEGTLPHQVTGRFGSSVVELIPASPGTGVVAGRTVRWVLELAGVRDCLTKSKGSNTEKNLTKATMMGLISLTSRSKVEELRGVSLEKTHVDEILETGKRFVAVVVDDDAGKAKGPVNIVGEKKGGGKGRKGRGRGGARSEAPAPRSTASAGADKPRPKDESKAVTETPAPTPVNDAGKEKTGTEKQE